MEELATDIGLVLYNSATCKKETLTIPRYSFVLKENVPGSLIGLRCRRGSDWYKYQKNNSKLFCFSFLGTILGHWV